MNFQKAILKRSTHLYCPKCNFNYSYYESSNCENCGEVNPLKTGQQQEQSSNLSKYCLVNNK